MNRVVARFTIEEKEHRRDRLCYDGNGKCEEPAGHERTGKGAGGEMRRGGEKINGG